ATAAVEAVGWREGYIRLQRKVGNHLSDKDIAAVIRMEQQAVLSPPAHPCQQGGTDLWDGGIVGERFKAVVWNLLSQRLTEALKIFPGNQVVVGHHRITGDVALRMLPRIVGEQTD